MPQESAYTFGSFRLLPARQLLVLDGSAVRLGGRAFELLHLLVRRSGELITKDELMTAAWPDIFVHESNLKVNIHSLRRSLGDTQKQPTYIATIAGRGYRFVAPVQLGVADIADAGVTPEAGGPGRLPLPRDVVAREREIAHLLARLRGKSQVSVLGPAGVGKTTVAIAAARAFEADCPDGVRFVDLSTIDDPTLLPSALVAALGLRGDMGDALTAVVDHLRQRSILVLLDNCEHVLPAVAIFARKLASQPGRSKLLVTSREPLGVPSESVMRLDALAVPPDGTPASIDDVLRFPAVELFVRRASEWAGYQLVDADCASVAQICRSLDGLPLAIELVAGKLDLHTPQELVAMVDEHFGFHNERTDGASPRHETLLAAIDWSFGLLAPNEATIFCLVSVFVGAFDLEDVVAVAAARALAPFDVIAGLGGLVAKSLLTAQVNGAGLRYRLLDSTRRYATKKRHEAGLDAQARRSHARRILALFEQSEAEWGWRDSDDWTQSYLGRTADVQAAFAWAFGDPGDAALGVRLTVATIPLWFETSLIAEAQGRVEVALEHAETFRCDDLLKTKLAMSRAWSMMYARTYVAEIEKAWLTAMVFAGRAGNLAYELQALVGLAIYLMRIGRIADSIGRLEQFRAICARRQDWSLSPEGERMLAWAKAHTGELAESLAVLEGLAATHSRVGRGSRMAGFQVDRFIGIRCYIPVIAWMSGRPDQAAAVARDAIEAAEGLGHLASQSNVLAVAGCPVAYWIGDLDALDRYTTRLLSILERETIGLWVPIQRFYAAALDDLRGNKAAISRMRGAIDEIIESRFVQRVAGCIGILAESFVREGRLDEASDAIAEAMRYEAQLGERWCRSELMRIEALVLDRAGYHERAEELLLSALDEAHVIKALSYELRIATDLAAHHARTNRSDEAMSLLSPVYRRFNEGFATRDLMAASRLLQRAGGGRAPL
ncbi:ATP-binding protein [Reyranella sp.]|uniref:ATP-binding protein n=1 Tax=Reyranella sp. TaxID=1929291 RepID=UPI003D14E4A5